MLKFLCIPADNLDTVVPRGFHTAVGFWVWAKCKAFSGNVLLCTPSSSSNLLSAALRLEVPRIYEGELGYGGIGEAMAVAASEDDSFQELTRGTYRVVGAIDIDDVMEDGSVILTVHAIRIVLWDMVPEQLPQENQKLSVILEEVQVWWIVH